MSGDTPAGRPAPAAPRLDELTLDASTYAVYVRIPLEWCSEEHTIAAVADVLHVTRRSVRLRLNWLTTARLVEKRRRQTIVPEIEIRRVGK